MTELKIAEVVLTERHKRNMTQEELASALGVSPQAVSNWERGGYPDITMLPVIANYFGITVDALIGNDEIGRRQDIHDFWENIYAIEDEDEQLQKALDYSRKYPKEYSIAERAAYFITELPEKKRTEHLPLLREICERILAECTEQAIREDAVKYMCWYCTDEEFELRWENLCSAGYDSHRREVEEERLWRQGRREESRVRFDVNNLHILLHFMNRTNRNWAAAERAAQWFKIQIRLLEFLAEDGEIPRAWWGRNAEMHFKAGCALCGCGRAEEGRTYIEKAFELFPKWYAIPNGEALAPGSRWLFGEMKILKGEWQYVLPGEEPQYLPDGSGYNFTDRRGFMTYALTAPRGWEWFNGVRGEPWFAEYVERAKALDVQWPEEN